MESAQELESKLKLYRSQLDQVSQLLAIQPDNEQFLTLKGDLEKVITLTEVLCAQVSEGQTASSSRKQVGNISHHSHSSIVTDHPTKASAATDEDAAAYSPSHPDSPDEADDIHGTDDLFVEEHNQSPSFLKEYLSRPFSIGDHVEVIGESAISRVYAAVITSKIHATEFQVKYYDFSGDNSQLPEVALPSSSLRHIPPGPYKKEDNISLHMKCQCKYLLDGQYYNVTIVGLTQFGYRIHYTDYGNSEEVPIEYLRPMMLLTKQEEEDASGASGDQQQSYNNNSSNSNNNKYTNNKQQENKNSSQKGGGGLIPIPENLQILPTDTEEEKNRKKKKMKIIKNKNRLFTQEQEVAQVQQSWQKFVTKGTKRNLTGVSSLSHKSSMFASNESNEGKVGVVNSGKGMTQFVERKKHKFNGGGDGEEDT